MLSLLLKGLHLGRVTGRSAVTSNLISERGQQVLSAGQQVSYDVDTHNDISEQNIVQGHGSP